MPARYLVIANEIKEQILASQSITPRRLPTEQELCVHYHVSRQTIREALSLLEKEGYITKRQGSGSYTVPLKQYLRSKKIVLLLQDLSGYTTPALISDIESVLRPQGFVLTALSTENDYNTERELLTQFLNEQVSILITEGVRTSLPSPNKDLYEKLKFGGCKLIFFNHFPPIADARSLCTDDQSGGHLLGEHLIAAQLYDPAIILPDFCENAGSRYHGLLTAYRDHDLSIPSSPVFWYSSKDLLELRLRQKTDFLKRFISEYLSEQDSIFCYNDEIAYYMIRELNQSGASVPGKYSVVSFDNSYLSTLSHPPITSLGLPFHEPGTSLGNMIAEILLDQTPSDYAKQTDRSNTVTLNEAPYWNKKGSRLLPWKLYPRNSTASLF